VNCAAIPEELIESELFGHVKGSFTGAVRDKAGKFELARGGTLFLDEIGDLRIDLQAKILRALQERQVDRVGGNHPLAVDVRGLAATNRDIERAVKEGAFREDLYYRLNVITLQMPPLRERREDIPLLARYFLKKFNAADVGIDPPALSALQAYGWPGNVRELENVIERASVLRRGDLVTLCRSAGKAGKRKHGVEDIILNLPEEGILPKTSKKPYHQGAGEAQEQPDQRRNISASRPTLIYHGKFGLKSA
jgi:two-component system NtrC family response regulator